MSKSDAGLIASSQNMAFAISKFLGGVLSDRISARLLFSAGLLLSGVATLFFSACDSVFIFTLLWFLNGIGQGAGWPACAKVIRQWSPPEQFGTWWSVLSASTNVSGAVSPFVAAFVILAYGWRASLILAGSVSIGIGVICLVAVINTPVDLGWKSYAPKVKEDPKSKDETSKGKHSKPQQTWRDLMGSPFLWLLSFCYMVVFCGKTSAVDWGQMYLMEDLGHSQYVGSAFTSSLESGGFFGGVASGYITDYLLTRPKTGPGSPRMPVAFLFTVGVALGLHLLKFWVSEDTSQFFISSLGFFLGLNFYGSISIFGVVAAETAPPNLSGTAHAIVALAANLGAVMSGLPFSYIAKEYNWGAIFILLEGITLLTVLVMLVTWNMRGRVDTSKED